MIVFGWLNPVTHVMSGSKCRKKWARKVPVASKYTAPYSGYIFLSVRQVSVTTMDILVRNVYSF